MPENFKNICVFCGASAGARPEYKAAAEDLGQELVRRGMGLVYGGGNVGLMGAVAKTVSEGGAHVYGVIPEALFEREVSGTSWGETKVVQNMHERKAAMAEASDAFIALPGGYGTMEETFEMITAQQLGYSAKPVGLLNVGGYYDKLLGFFDHMLQEGFVRPDSRTIVVAAPTPQALLDQLQAYEAPESLISLAKRGALSDGQRG